MQLHAASMCLACKEVVTKGSLGNALGRCSQNSHGDSPQTSRLRSCLPDLPPVSTLTMHVLHVKCRPCPNKKAPKHLTRRRGGVVGRLSYVCCAEYAAAAHPSRILQAQQVMQGQAQSKQREMHCKHRDQLCVPDKMTRPRGHNFL